MREPTARWAPTSAPWRHRGSWSSPSANRWPSATTAGPTSTSSTSGAGSWAGNRDDELPAGVALAEVAEGVGGLAQGIAPFHDRPDGPFLQLSQGHQVLVAHLGDEEDRLLAGPQRRQAHHGHVPELHTPRLHHPLLAAKAQVRT